MKYAELDAKAQARVREKWLEHEPRDEWWDSTYEDTIECARKLGIEIGTRDVRIMSGKAISEPDISFSGFWSQGDGCCFSGTLRVAEMFEAKKDMAEHAPNDEELMRLAGVAEEIFAQISAYRIGQRLLDDPTFDEWPECGPTMTMRINGQTSRGYSTRVDDNYTPSEIDKACDEFVGHFADWIYGQLEAEHEYLTSDDAFDAWIEANDPDFDEDGNLE